MTEHSTEGLIRKRGKRQEQRQLELFLCLSPEPIFSLHRAIVPGARRLWSLCFPLLIVCTDTHILLLTVTVMVMVQRHSRTVANNGGLNIIDDHFALVVSSIISTGLPTVPAHCSLHHCSKSPVHLAPVATFAPATLLTRSVAKG